MAKLFGVVCAMLPNVPGGERKLRMVPTVYTSQAEAEEYVRQVSRENLPYTASVVKLDLP